MRISYAVPAPSNTSELPAPSALSSSERSFEGPRETVIRPDGMRKGLWEAPSTFFWGAASLLVVVVVVWVLFRFGVVKLPKRKPKPTDESPRSVDKYKRAGAKPKDEPKVDAKVEPKDEPKKDAEA